MLRSSIITRSTATVLMALLPIISFTGCTPSHNDNAVVSQASQFNQSLAPAEMRDATLDGYLQTVGARIVAAAKRANAQKIGPKTHFSGETKWMFEDVHFYLINSKTLNAFTTGGHAVYIYNELFQLCKSEDQLAAVMSHEFAHIYCRHVQKGMNNQMAMAALAVAAGGAGYVAGGEQHGAEYAQAGAGVGAAAGKFIETGFTRKDEAQADQYGDIFYAMAGWDPAHFGDFFRVMKDKVGDVASDLTSDHPSLTSRYTIAEQRATSLEHRRPDPSPGPVASAEQFAQYQRLAVDLSGRTPNDTQVLNTKKLLQALPRSCWIPVPQPDQVQAQQELLKNVQVKDEPQTAQ